MLRAYNIASKEKHEFKNFRRLNMRFYFQLMHSVCIKIIGLAQGEYRIALRKLDKKQLLLPKKLICIPKPK